MTFFRQHEFSLKYSPLITSLYQNHYQNDNQIVHRCYMQTRLPIQDLCTLKKWHLLVRIIVVIIQNIGHSRLLPTLLYQNSFGEWIVWKHLLLHDQVLANKDLVDLESSSQFSARYFFILWAPLLTPFNSDMLSLRKFTINWRLQSKWQSMWQSKWLSLSLHLQMNNEYLNILHSIIFYQDVTVWHLLTVFGVTVWHLHKLWHGNGTF